MKNRFTHSTCNMQVTEEQRYGRTIWEGEMADATSGTLLCRGRRFVRGDAAVFL